MVVGGIGAVSEAGGGGGGMGGDGNGTWTAGGGAVGSLLRSHDWSRTALGPADTWPQGLKAAVGTILNTRHPMVICWGPDHLCLHNDACLPYIAPERHRGALGAPGHAVWPEAWDTLGRQVDQVLRGGTPTWNEDQRLPLRRDGGVEDVWWTFSCGPIHADIEQTTIGGVLIVGTDTTRTVRARRDSEARYRGLFQAIDEGFCVIEVILDADGRPVDYRHLEVNAAFERQTGLSGAVGWRVSELVHDLEPGWIERYGTVALTGEPIRFVAEVGAIGRSFDVYAFPVDDPARRHVAVLFRNVTARLRADALLREREDRLAIIFARAPVGLSELSPDGQFRKVNDALCRMLGRTREELLSLGIADVTHPEDFQRSVDAVRDSLGAGQPVTLEKRYVKPDGSLVWARSAVTPLNGDYEIRLLAVTVDLTERVAAEDALRAALDAAEAAQSVAERAQAAAEEANRAKSRFLAAASHDLRQPVMAAGLYLGLLEKRVRETEARGLVDMVSLSLEGLRGMLNGLLEMARLEAGVVRPSVEAFALDDLLQRLAAEFTGQARAARLWLQVPPTAAIVRTDRLLLELILRNLISNAVKFTRRGGVAVECAVDGSDLRIEVTDTGPGIPQEQRARMFEDFVQMDEGRRSLGFGIGLATVRRAAAVLGHRLEFQSEPGRGTTFCIHVPLDPDAAAEAATRDVAEERVIPPRRALVVEDDRIVASALCMALEDWGVAATLAHSVAEAAAAAAEGRFDMIVSDYQLPDGDGFDAIDAGRASGAIPAVLLTGDTRPETLRRAHEAGLRLLTKPVDIRSLQRVVLEMADAAPP